MTPEEARALEHGTTPGPWTMHRYVPEDFIRVTGEDLKDIADNGIVEDADARLIAAAPDMRATIAAQTWEWRVEVFAPSIGEWVDPWNLWSPEEEARKEYADLTSDDRAGDYRLVRRPVGPVEVVE